MKIYKDFKAKQFFHAALQELDNVLMGETALGNTFSLKENCGGYWKEGDCYVAFDNHSNNLTVEEFSSIDEAKKYAKGILATTKDGQEI